MWIIMKKLKDKISLQLELNWQYSHWRRIFEILMVWRDVISFYECDPILFLFFATGYWRDPHYPLDNSSTRDIPKQDISVDWPDSPTEVAGVTQGETHAEEAALPGRLLAETILLHIFLDLKPVVGTEVNVVWAHGLGSRLPDVLKAGDVNTMRQTRECCWPCKDWTLCVPSVSCSDSSWLAVRSAEGAPAWCLLGLSRLCRW